MSKQRVARRVKIETRMVGQHFGCCGVVRDLRGRKLLETDVFPYGHDANAYSRAVAQAEAKGWIVCDWDADDETSPQ